jgi:FKBP-type peptidyl-prolyl cis-trans isomerase 2
MPAERTPASDYSLGDFVYLPAQLDWGAGQVQSVIGNRVTVNFDHAGKQLINTDVVRLHPLPPEGLPESE